MPTVLNILLIVFYSTEQLCSFCNCILFILFLSHLILLFFEQELDHVVEELEKVAVVNLLQHRSIISLIGNVQRSSLILEKVLYTFCRFS